jgi:hypothetical protein
MGRAIALVLLIGTAPACRQDVIRECPSGGGDGTCEAACENLRDLDCAGGQKQSECVAACEAASVNVPADVLGRALGCYATVDDCREVDGCSRACGDDDGPVPWTVGGDGGVDAGEPGVDAGVDSGVDAGVDAG